MLKQGHAVWASHAWMIFMTFFAEFSEWICLAVRKVWMGFLVREINCRLSWKRKCFCNWTEAWILLHHDDHFWKWIRVNCCVTTHATCASVCNNTDLKHRKSGHNCANLLPGSAGAFLFTAANTKRADVANHTSPLRLWSLPVPKRKRGQRRRSKAEESSDSERSSSVCLIKW